MDPQGSVAGRQAPPPVKPSSARQSTRHGRVATSSDVQSQQTARAQEAEPLLGRPIASVEPCTYNEDPYLNELRRLKFEDVVPEPPNLPVFPRCVDANKQLYDVVFRAWYNLLSVTTGFFFVIVLASLYAILTFMVVWFYYPLAKLMRLLLNLMGNLIDPACDVFLRPLYQAASHCLGGIRIDMTMKAPITNARQIQLV